MIALGERRLLQRKGFFITSAQIGITGIQTIASPVVGHDVATGAGQLLLQGIADGYGRYLYVTGESAQCIEAGIVESIVKVTDKKTGCYRAV